MKDKKWTLNKRGIVNSLKRVIKTKNIDHLTLDAYRFVMNISGFIAHYNIHGFKGEYENVADLIADLQRSSDILHSGRYIDDPFFGKGDQAEYYRTKAETLIEIADLISGIKIGSETITETFQRTVKTM